MSELKKKNLIFIGAPGAGKGTFAGLLKSRYPIAHISTGDLLRDEIKRDTGLGRVAAGIIKEGKLMPDQVVADMVRARLGSDDCRNGFILDGYPRTIRQAELLNEVLADLGLTLDRVIFFDVPEKELIARLTTRLCCRKCGAIFNKLHMPPKVDGVCDKCSGELFQRPDDSEETAKSRLKVFTEQTSPLIAYYTKTGQLFRLPESAGAKKAELFFAELQA